MTDIIFNADDFGLTAGVTRAIVRASSDGVVHSTTAMVCRGNDDIIKAWSSEMVGGIGLHLQLTDGHPLLSVREIRSLVGKDGRFPRNPKGLANPDPHEVRLEWQAQLEHLRSLGIRPTHIDTHHHVHMRKEILPVYAEFARANGLPARSGPPFVVEALKQADVSCPERCITGWSTGLTSSGQMIAAISEAIGRNPGKVIEFVCHPGFVDAALIAVSSWQAVREIEYEALCAPELRAALQAAGMISVPISTRPNLGSCPDEWCRSCG